METEGLLSRPGRARTALKLRPPCVQGCWPTSRLARLLLVLAVGTQLVLPAQLLPGPARLWCVCVYLCECACVC